MNCPLINYNLVDGKCNRDFNLVKLIGQGSYGRVYQARDNCAEQLYAIKQISFEDLNDEKAVTGLQELELMSRMQSPYVVQYKDSWIENNNCIHIQMEFCCDNLQNVIETKAKLFAKTKYCLTEFFISCELFEEIALGLNYLHSMRPPVIHRDLKPENILLTNTNSRHFVKITDFGLSKLHEFDGQLHSTDKGTVTYMAPEVASGRQYDCRSDIFSFGIIASELFDVDVYNPTKSLNKKIQRLNQNYKILWKTITAMLSYEWMTRPSCLQLITKSKNWSLCPFDIYEAIEYSDVLKYLLKLNQLFFYQFILAKRNIHLKGFEHLIKAEKENNDKHRNHYLQLWYKTKTIIQSNIKFRQNILQKVSVREGQQIYFKRILKSNEKISKSNLNYNHAFGTVDRLKPCIGELIELKTETDINWAIYMGYETVLHLSNNRKQILETNLIEFCSKQLCRINNLDETAKNRGLVALSVDEIIEKTYDIYRNFRHISSKRNYINFEYFVTECRFGVGFSTKHKF